MGEGEYPGKNLRKQLRAALFGGVCVCECVVECVYVCEMLTPLCVCVVFVYVAHTSVHVSVECV